MQYQGHIANGVVVFDEPTTLPDGTKVEVLVDIAITRKHPRRGGQYAGQIVLAEDFDQWPEDISRHLEIES